jgi:RecA/RadA recombinase
MDRLSTGNVRLDEVLGGGLILDAITLVVGAPGTGKTILAEQCLTPAVAPRGGSEAAAQAHGFAASGTNPARRGRDVSCRLPHQASSRRTFSCQHG